MASSRVLHPRPALSRLRRFLAASVSAFLQDTRGSVALTTVAFILMALGTGAFISDRLWLIDQRDTLRRATDAASIGAALEMNRLLEDDPTLTDSALKDDLKPVARHLAELNLSHLPAERLARAKETLVVELAVDRAASRVEVAAEADLGGTLFARALAIMGNYAGPGTMSATASVECASTAIEVVLALDVTASMHGKIDNNLPATGDNRRLNAVIKAAKALVDDLHASCEGSSIAVGVVPWDKTVRLPDPDRWRLHHWVVNGPNRLGLTTSDWAGCVEDRAHNANPLVASALARATSLSLDLPSSRPFPAFIYPDTRAFSVAPMAAQIRADFPALSGTEADLNLEERLEGLRDNDWGRSSGSSVGGANFHCTSTGMLALTTSRAAVEAVLDRVLTNRVWSGGTIAHLGVTWARRMLAPSWRDVWDGEVHPIDPASREVTKVLVLLTDGGNVLEDRHRELPGRLDAKHVGVPECLGSGTRPKTCRQGDLGTFYSALGRLGPGPGGFDDGKHGYYYPGWGLKGTTGAGSKTTETALSALMKRSCALARGEGVTVYTIGAMPSVKRRWRDALVACSGAPGTADADRAGFHFHAADGAGLDRAFRTIAQRVVTLRRAS